MNILFVSPSFNPLDGTGWGSTQRTNLLFEACTQLGHVDVISFVDGVTSSREDCMVLYSDSVPKANQKEGRVMKFLRMLTPLNPYAMFNMALFSSSSNRLSFRKEFKNFEVKRGKVTLSLEPGEMVLITD